MTDITEIGGVLAGVVQNGLGLMFFLLKGLLDFIPAMFGFLLMTFSILIDILPQIFTFTFFLLTNFHLILIVAEIFILGNVIRERTLAAKFSSYFNAHISLARFVISIPVHLLNLIQAAQAISQTAIQIINGVSESVRGIVGWFISAASSNWITGAIAAAAVAGVIISLLVMFKGF